MLDYRHKITTWLVREYDAVFVEELNVRSMLQGDGKQVTPRRAGVVYVDESIQ